MIVALASFALVLLSAPAVTVPFARGIHPRDWTRWSFAALIVGALAAEAGLVLFALPTVLRALGAHALVAACARMTGSLMPGGPVVGWSALSVATLGPLAVALELLQARRSQHTLSVCVAGVATEQIGDQSVVVIPIGDVLAFTVAGPRPVIVVSCGMKEVMSADQLGAVVRHEASHANHRHDRLLALLAGLERGFVLLPIVKRSAAAVRCGIERWADEDAAGSTLDGRRLVRDALMRAVFADTPVGVAAFGAVATIAVRIDALRWPLRVSARPRRILVIAMSVAMLLAVSSAAAGAAELWRVLVMPAFCDRR